MRSRGSIALTPRTQAHGRRSPPRFSAPMRVPLLTRSDRANTHCRVVELAPTPRMKPEVSEASCDSHVALLPPPREHATHEHEDLQGFSMGREGIEPSTLGLRVPCSTS